MYHIVFLFWEIQFLKTCFEGMRCGEIRFEEIQFWDLWFHGMQFGENKVWGNIVSRNTVSRRKKTISEEFVTSLSDSNIKLIFSLTTKQSEFEV